MSKATEKKKTDLTVEEPVEKEESVEPAKKPVDVNELIEKGKTGALSTSDLEEAIESLDYDMDSLDKIYEAFEDNGVSLPDEISSSPFSVAAKRR